MEELYRMILVDDEDEVRGRISSKISLESGFSVVGTAGNGYDAIELIEKYSPHIVLTDIKMPFIDGIELASIIKRDYPTIRVAFITGYDEFDYAREAIDLGVVSYLTKPLTQNDVSKFLKKLKVDLDNEFQEKYSLEKLKKKYEQSIPLVIDNYFSSCLVSSRSERGDDIETLKNYGVSLDDASYLLSFIRIDRSDKGDVVELEKLKLSVRSVTNSILERHKYDHYSFMFADGIVFVIKEKGKLFLKDIDSVFFEMVKMAEKYLSTNIDIGVSSLHREFSELYSAYEEASNAIAYSKFLNAGRIVYIDQLEKKTPSYLSLGEADIKNIEYTARFGTDSEIRNVMETLKLNALRDNKTITNYQLYIINMMNVLVNFANSIEADLTEIAEGDILERITRFRSLDQLFDWVLSVLIKLRERNLHTKMSNSRKMLEKSVAYIDSNFQDPGISMDRVCEEFGISVSYLSLLFKKDMGTTFVKYLTGLRIDKAKELLKLTGDRIVEIAEQCGFNDVYYFSHCFKKHTGVSPKKYREEQNTL